MKRFRPLIQLLFLGIFVALMFGGKAQIWMGIIFISILLSGYFGRYYCGWVCPINTLIRPVVFIKQKLGLKEKEVPLILMSEKPRLLTFGLFLVGLSYTIYTISQGRKFPLPLIIIPLGLITAILISEKAWHRYLCPWGVLFSLTGRFAKLGLTVDTGCTSCTACVKVCPAEAITVAKKQLATVDSTHCLLCFDCQDNCPSAALHYRNPSKEISKKVKFPPSSH